MSDKPRKIKHSRFEYIDPNILIEKPRVLKHLRFEYLIPEFVRPDFKIPSEEDPIEKGNEPMDEELFTEETIKRLTEPEGAAPRNSEYYETLVVDIETYTNHALKLQMAVIEAETQLENARQKYREVESHLNDLAMQRREDAIVVKNARAKLQEHLDSVRKTHVTLRKGRHE